MAAAPQTEVGPSFDLVFNTLNAYQRSAALHAAIELDLFRAVGETAGDVPSLARFCSASERGIRILCDYVAILGLLIKTDGRYRHSPTSAVFLDPHSPASIASTARFMGHPELTRSFEHLAETIRHGRTAQVGEGDMEAEMPVWVEFAKSMAPITATMAGPLASIALDGQSGPVRVLDIAAGHGLFGIAVAKQNPGARVVAVDWAPVLEVARENAQKAGVEDRIELLPGSAFEVDFGGGGDGDGAYDLALLTNFLHHFDPPTCVGLLKKVRASMKPGGRAVTLEFVPNEDRVSPPMAAAFSLVMLANTPAGDAYTFRELERMYREAGFERISAAPVAPSPETAVVGYAP
jgi:2-polyprenyl-3-methyl-5-hydroxy-6-metoxy-1,4-benzoquinol methylase